MWVIKLNIWIFFYFVPSEQAISEMAYNPDPCKSFLSSFVPNPDIPKFLGNLDCLPHR